MSDKEDAFFKELLAAFQIEAAEHVGLIAAGLWELQKKPDNPNRDSILEGIYRDAHSLKGAARAVNNRNIEIICQALENVFAASKRKTIRFEPGQFDALNQAVDAVRMILGGTGGKEDNITGIIKKLDTIAQDIGDAPAGDSGQAPQSSRKTSPTAQPPAEKAGAIAPAVHPDHPMDTILKNVAGTETVRIAVGKLDTLLFEVEEMLAIKQTAIQRANNLREMEASFAQWKSQWIKAVSRLRADGLHSGNGKQPGSNLPENALSDLFKWQAVRMKAMEESLKTVTRQADEDQRTTGRMINELLEDVRKAVMLPATRILHGFPKMIHDLCRSRGKEAEIHIDGGDIEMDKRILEEMKDPLTHLLRNCADHGIETPEERKRRDKPPAGAIKIKLSHLDSSHVQIVIADDGAGINTEAIKAAAIKQGVLSPVDAKLISEEQARMLIFQSAVSTSLQVNDLSGRGLGLAIVREKVEKLGGRVSLETSPGKGTTFRIVLPLTLATFRGVLIREAEQLFVIPTVNVERVIRVQLGEVKTVENREAINFGGKSLGLARLQTILEMPAQSEEKKRTAFPVIVLAAADQRLAFRVDGILEEQEVLVKNLGKQLAHVRNIGGATVLASGAVIPILNAAELIQSAALKSGAGAVALPSTAPQKTESNSLLLAEDSITARMLLKNILQTAGYRVRTAVDGAEAWSFLKTETFDAVISDVEMPSLDGFGLTARIRADAKLAELPVILVTARESREDRERGIDAGANAYIIKSSFDQSNLLNVLKNLV